MTFLVWTKLVGFLLKATRAYGVGSEHFQETVTLVVGSEKKAYNVHIGLLSFYSDYFRAAFQGSFKEAIERKMELPGVTKDVFERFQVWLYTTACW